MSTVTIGSRRLGDGQPAFITFEAGPTHSGPESAKRLIDHAAAAGADAIKFHFTDPDRIIADRSVEFTFDVLTNRDPWTTETISQPLYEIVSRRVLAPAQWRDVRAHAAKAGIAFFGTAVFEDHVDFLQELGCDSIKIASNDVTHFPLIRKAARTGMCIQLDTGNATLGDIEQAVDVVLAEGNDRIIIHHCPHGYPARPDGVNLNVITTLKTMFPFPVAFSDHTPGYVMDVAALTLGANLLEKTITEDKTTRSPEHIFSLEPDEMAKFVGTVRDVEMAFGDRRRVFGPEEWQRRHKLRRGAYLKVPAQKGTPLSELELEFRRPAAGGMAPSLYDGLGKARLARDMEADEPLRVNDLILEED